MIVFERSSTQYVTFQWRYDADGKVWANAQAHDTLVAKTPYMIIVNEFGQITKGLAGGTIYCLIGCPYAAAAAADELWLQIGGYITDMVTAAIDMEVGEAMDVDSGSVADNAADYTGEDGEFAVCAADSVGAEATQDAMLVPRQILTT